MDAALQAGGEVQELLLCGEDKTSDGAPPPLTEAGLITTGRTELKKSPADKGQQSASCFDSSTQIGCHCILCTNDARDHQQRAR